MKESSAQHSFIHLSLTKKIHPYIQKHASAPPKGGGAVAQKLHTPAKTAKPIPLVAQISKDPPLSGTKFGLKSIPLLAQSTKKVTKRALLVQLLHVMPKFWQI